MGWSKRSPNNSSCREAGHITPVIERLNFCPKCIDCSKAGHKTPSMGWLKLLQSRSFRREIGQITESTLLMLENQPTCRLKPPRTSVSGNFTGSFIEMSLAGMAHIALDTCTAGTRLTARDSVPSEPACAFGDEDHMQRGVRSCILTCTVATAWQALQKSSEANCRYLVDAYQVHLPPTHS